MEHSTGRMRDSAWTAPSPDEVRADTLRLLFEVNERALHQIAHSMTAAATDEPGHAGARFASELRDVWRNTDAAMLARAAAFPALLLDLRGWNAGGEGRGFFPNLCAVPLLRSALTLAWHVCRTDRLTAGILLGLPPDSIEMLRHLRLNDLERIVLTRAHCLRPRWLATPSMWTGLLMASRESTARAFEDFKLRALQKMIGELLQPHADD